MRTRLKFAPYSSAYSVHYDNPRGVSLVSYATRVIDLIYDTETPEPVIKVRGTFSITTQKHMRAFVREYVDADPDAVMKAIRTIQKYKPLWSMRFNGFVQQAKQQGFYRPNMK